VPSCRRIFDEGFIILLFVPSCRRIFDGGFIIGLRSRCYCLFISVGGLTSY